jgi:hypothetical protein
LNRGEDLIIKTFFNAEYLERYMSEKAGVLLSTFDLGEFFCIYNITLIQMGEDLIFWVYWCAEGILKSLLDSDIVDEIIDTKLEELSKRPEGMWLSMMGVENKSLKPMVKPLILGLGGDVAPMVKFLFTFFLFFCTI